MTVALKGRLEPGSPWDEDKAMMGRWGLEGMGSFSQANVARKEGARLGNGLEVGDVRTAAPTNGSKEGETIGV